jgi:hypothetical protein
MSEPFDVVVIDGGAATEDPRRAVDRGDPFSASSEARVHQLVTGHRRHGLDTAIRPVGHRAQNRAGCRPAGNLAGTSGAPT